MKCQGPLFPKKPGVKPAGALTGPDTKPHQLISAQNPQPLLAMLAGRTPFGFIGFYRRAYTLTMLVESKAKKGAAQLASCVVLQVGFEGK